jgi:hypothetical protein
MSVEGGPDIVTDGLVLCLDAANRKSFVSGSSTWFDLSIGGNNSASLFNTPTFSSESFGTLIFDGTNEYGLIPSFSYNFNGPFSLSVSFIKRQILFLKLYLVIIMAPVTMACSLKSIQRQKDLDLE